MVDDAFLRNSHQIGRQIAQAANWQGRQCSWPDSETKRSTDGEVYEGTAGVAWYLARLALATGDAVLKRTAAAAARHALAWVQSGATADEAGLHSSRIGALWAAADVGRHLQDMEIEELALSLVPPLLDKPALTHPEADVVAGGAGSLLALTGLARLQPTFRTDAARLGDRLAGQVGGSLARLLLGSRQSETNPLPVGLGHGVSGLAWSFLELYKLEKDERFKQLALAGMRYERAWFDRRLCTWRDPLYRGPVPVSWCNGSVGIALVRLRALESAPSAQLRAEAGAALAKVHAAAAGALNPASSKTWEQSNYSVCHGLMGMADLLLYAAQVLNVSEHEAAGRRLVESGQGIANAQGGWPYGTLEGAPSYGLMLGLAGIGAVMLRFANPDFLPPIGLLSYSSASEKKSADRPSSS